MPSQRILAPICTLGQKSLTEEWIELFHTDSIMDARQSTSTTRSPMTTSSSDEFELKPLATDNNMGISDSELLTQPESIALPTVHRPRDTHCHPENGFVTSDNARLDPASAVNNPYITSLLPREKYRPWISKLRWEIFSVYMRLYILIITANATAIITLAATAKPVLLLPKTSLTAIAVNLTAGILMRHDLTTNLLFVLFGLCPQWMPLRVRRLTAKIYHFGGVHSGAGIGALIWFTVFTVVLVKSLTRSAFGSIEQTIVALTAILDVLILAIITSSHPKFRASWHNTWECLHRYGGWTAIGLFWILFGLLAIMDRRLDESRVSIAMLLLTNVGFWLLILVTLCIIWPWIWLRKVVVRPEILSNHAIRLHFQYTNLPLCAAPRVTDAPLKEWHSFAGIPHRNGPGFSLLVSKAGDWTTKIIQNPPTHLWVRGLPVRGVLHIAPIFKKSVLVATGSGIGPVMSLLVSCDVQCRILWSTPHPQKTYGDRVINEVLRADPDAVIINTSEKGRPNIAQEAYKLYNEFQAEAIFVISNPVTCRNVVPELEKRGIPIFAPVFDS